MNMLGGCPCRFPPDFFAIAFFETVFSGSVLGAAFFPPPVFGFAVLLGFGFAVLLGFGFAFGFAFAAPFFGGGQTHFAIFLTLETLENELFTGNEQRTWLVENGQLV